MSTLKQAMRDHAARIESALSRTLSDDLNAAPRLLEAMRYGVMGGGKRVRPLLVYLTGEALDVPLSALDAPAVAIELIHCYSLVHDDLPAMDNDDLRRGRPTCHKVYGDAMAILAGDALQTLAFSVLSASAPLAGLDPAQKLALVESLADASGAHGMCGGQAIDLDAVGQPLTLEQLKNMHAHKTGALIRAAVRMGALCRPGISSTELDHLDVYARAVGLAFQVWDDVLDIEGDTEVIGKPQGSDAARNKPTYPNLLGLDGAKAEAARLNAKAKTAVSFLGERGQALCALADYIVSREK